MTIHLQPNNHESFEKNHSQVSPAIVVQVHVSLFYHKDIPSNLGSAEFPTTHLTFPRTKKQVPKMLSLR